MLIRTRAWHLFRFGRLTRSLVTAQKAFHNKLYFFRALLTHLYLLSFALSEDFLFRADVIYPIQFFLHVIGIPAWALPVTYAACSGGWVAHPHPTAGLQRVLHFLGTVRLDSSGRRRHRIRNRSRYVKRACSHRNGQTNRH
jgi:hypothetical protein